MRASDPSLCGATTQLLVGDGEQPLPVYCDQPRGHPGWHSSFHGVAGDRVQWTDDVTETTTQTETFAELVGQGVDATGVARPGDALLFSLDRAAFGVAPSPTELRAQLLELMPGVVDVAIIPGLRLEAIYRPEPADG